MDCKICRNEGSNAALIYNDCVIECLEKIKTHYLNYRKQLMDNELIIKSLKETNHNLEKTVNSYENIARKKARKAGSEDLETSPKCLDISADPNTADKSAEDLNIALNDEEEFEISLIKNTPVKNKVQNVIVKRDPMKTITSTVINDPAKNLSTSKSNKPESTKSSCWMSKENEIKKSFMGSFYKHSNRSLKRSQLEHKSSNLSLTSGRLRQTRLQLDINKNMSDSGDSTFCEEVIEASPKSDSAIRKNVSSKQWTLRNTSNKSNKSDDCIFDISNTCSENLITEDFICDKANKRDNDCSFDTTNKCLNNIREGEEKRLESSSVVMLTPATQDVIFLDDSCESFNIESMDLLKDLMNPSESHLSNLKRMESNRIKMLQKTAGDKVEHLAKNNPEPNCNIEKVCPKSNKVRKADLKIEATSLDDIPCKEKPTLKLKKEIEDSTSRELKDEKCEVLRKQRLFNVDCHECQTYIKYLGTRLSDEEIERHIRSCTKHKKRIDVNLTPEGFWDPIIKPLDKNDPRNETLIDTRFIGKERRS